MNLRLRELRAHLKLNQEDFGARIGLTKSAVSNMEKGRYNVTETIIRLICKEFNVNYSWIKDGVGEVFMDSDYECMTKIDYIMSGEDDFAKRIFKAFSKLDIEEWKVIEKLIDEIAKK